MIQRLLRVALIGALLPATSWALGVGEIQVRSKLNEPLRAEIELIYSDTSEAEGAAVQLASVEDFERVGLDPSLAGNELMFNVVRNDQGNFVIEVTSLAPVVETFLDFLIEVQWENGRLLREYVILLDPPVTAPSPVQVAPLPSSEPPAPIARPTTTPSTTPRTTRPTRSTGGSDYTVARGDTLWEIARDYRPDDSITINQMMVAILRMNPDAFYENNVNALREGAILRIPDSAESAAISLGAANSTVQEHNELFNIYVRSQTGGAVPTISDAGADAEYDSASGRTAPSEADSRLELVPPGNDTRSVADRPGAGEEAQRMREELARVREDLISARQENTELQDRVGELEELVGSMERAISLKDADLADLESQLRAARETEADLTAGTTPAPVTEAPATSPIVEPEPTVPATTDQPIAEEPADQVPAGAAPPQPRPTTEPVTFDEEPGLLSNPLILGGGALVLLGLGGLGFMLYRRRQSTGDEPSYAVSDDDALFADIGAAAEADADMEPDDGADEASADAADLEASLKAELADDPGNAQTHLRLLRQYYADESTEKFVAAAAAMKETVGETHPAWMEVRSMGAKLAPADALFGDAGDPSADSGETQIMMTTPPPTPAADLGDDDDIDLDLDLGDDAITDDSTREIPAQAVAAADAEEDFDFDLDLDLEGDDDDLPDLEFNLDDDEPEDVIEQAAEDVVDELDEGLEFNLDDLDLPGADTEVEAPADAESTGGDTGADDDDMSLDFDLSDIDLPEVDEAEAEEAEISAEPDLSDLEIEEELPSVDHLNETVEPLSEQESADLDDLELDLEGIGVDLNDTGEAEPLETEGDRTEFELEALDVGQDAGDVAGMDTAEMELDLGLDDDDGEDVDLDDLELSDTELFAGEESAGTKLDLARAYIEMGDPDGARGMLEEVLAEGSDEQKSEAQQLMDGLEG